MVELKVRAVRVGNSIRVAIPRAVLEAADLKVKDILLIDYDPKSKLITLRKRNP
jgi:antitoxin component of MazEF toxin-antitoxin module